MKQFTEYTGQDNDREFIPLKDLIGQVVVVTSFQRKQGDYGDYLLVEATRKGDLIAFNAGGILAEVIEKVEDDLPMVGKLITRISKDKHTYYCFGQVPKVSVEDFGI